MAKTTDNQTNPAAAPKAKEPVDYIEQIGRNLNPQNAKEIFGSKEKGYRAMHAVAAAGGYGVFSDADFDNYDRHLFGGFAIPQGDDHAETRAKINEALNNLE